MQWRKASIYIVYQNVECYARSVNLEPRASEMRSWLQKSAHFSLIPHMEIFFFTFHTCSLQPQLTLTQVASLEAILQILHGFHRSHNQVYTVLFSNLIALFIYFS